MANISKLQVQNIIENAPPGHSAGEIVQGLVSQGNKIEGLNYNPDVDGKLSPFSTSIQGEPTVQPTETPKQPSFIQKVSDFLLGETIELGKGAVKSVIETAGQTLQLPIKAAEAITGQKIPSTPGSPQQVGQYITERAKPSNTTQEVGKVLGDIAQFFIPGGAEKAAIGKIDEAIDMTKLVNQFGTKGAPIVKGLIKALGSGLVTGASTAGVQTLETGGQNVGTAGALGFLAGAGGKLISEIAPSVAQKLQESVLKLSPTKQSEIGTNIDNITKYITDKIGAGTPTQQYYGATKNVETYENTLQKFLKEDAGSVTVSKNDLIQKLEGLKGTFQTERDSLAIDKQIDGAITTLNKKWPAQIPVSDLNTLKRSTFRNAYNKAGTKVLDWVEAYIGNTFKGSIEDATKGMTIDGKAIQQFNQEYGTALQAKNLLKLAKGKQTSLSGKALLLLLGSPGGIAGEAAGLILGGTKGVSGLAKTSVGAMLPKIGSTLPSAVKTTIPYFTADNQQQ